ncbi:MAG: hypothetical protein AB1725_09880 [Armatimonadota bacterium]
MSVSLALLIAGAALAQGAGSGLERGGAGQGRPEDRPPALDLLQMNPLAIITLPAVREELQLTEEQSQKIREILAKARPGGDATPERRRALNDAALREVATILTPEQRGRFEQILLWVAGPVAMARPDVARRVGLTQEQSQKIAEMVRGFAQAMAPRADANPPDRQALRERVQKARAELDAKILELLTPEQRAAWDRLRGPEFRLPGGR